MPGKLLDFDAFLAERQEEPFRLIVGGREYKLPSSPPADIALRAARFTREHPQGITADEEAEEFEGLALGLFGREILDELLTEGLPAGNGHRRGLSIDELMTLIGQVMGTYGEQAAPRPNRKTRRAPSRRRRSTS